MPLSANQALARNQKLAAVSFAHQPAARRGQSRVRVDSGGVNEVITPQRLMVFVDHPRLVGLAVAVTDRTPQHAPAAAGGDLAHLLDIDVHHVPARGRFHAAHDPPSRAVDPPQLGHAVAGQDPMHRRGMDTQQIAATGRPPAPGHTHADDASLGPRRGAVRAVQGAGAAISHPRRTVAAIAIHPAQGCGWRHLEALGGAAIGPAVIDDATSKPQTTGFGQGALR